MRIKLISKHKYGKSIVRKFLEGGIPPYAVIDPNNPLYFTNLGDPFDRILYYVDPLNLGVRYVRYTDARDHNMATVEPIGSTKARWDLRSTDTPVRIDHIPYSPNEIYVLIDNEGRVMNNTPLSLLTHTNKAYSRLTPAEKSVNGSYYTWDPRNNTYVLATVPELALLWDKDKLDAIEQAAITLQNTGQITIDPNTAKQTYMNILQAYGPTAADLWMLGFMSTGRVLLAPTTALGGAAIAVPGIIYGGLLTIKGLTNPATIGLIAGEVALDSYAQSRDKYHWSDIYTNATEDEMKNRLLQIEDDLKSKYNLRYFPNDGVWDKADRTKKDGFPLSGTALGLTDPILFKGIPYVYKKITKQGAKQGAEQAIEQGTKQVAKQGIGKALGKVGSKVLKSGFVGPTLGLAYDAYLWFHDDDDPEERLKSEYEYLYRKLYGDLLNSLVLYGDSVNSGKFNGVAADQPVVSGVDLSGSSASNTNSYNPPTSDSLPVYNSETER